MTEEKVRNGEALLRRQSTLESGLLILNISTEFLTDSVVNDATRILPDKVKEVIHKQLQLAINDELNRAKMEFYNL